MENREEHVGALGKARLWWQAATGEDETPLDGDTPAWLVSMGFHVFVLLSLAAVVVPPERTSTPPITILQVQPDPTEPLDEVLPPPEEMVVAPPETSVGANSFGGDASAESLAPELSDMSVVPADVADLLDGDVKADPIEDQVVPEGFRLTDSLAVRGDVAVGTTGASGAVDRLTIEIKASLEQRPTLVAWVFDQSVSLSQQRSEIASRLDRVFDELGAAGPDPLRPELSNIVFAYGESVRPVVREPTRDCGRVAEAIRSISVDKSGVEMTFAAIMAAAEDAKSARSGPSRTNVMVVVFTDEVGNDEQDADRVSAFCRSQAIRVYVVGVPAPFGRRQVEARFVESDPDYAPGEQYPVVDQGPETLRPEALSINSGGPADEPMDSGFGPYSLSKVCAETGGIYFCVHPNRSVGVRVDETEHMASRLRRFFDASAMRPYRPAYLPAAKVDQTIAANKAKRALVAAASGLQLDPLVIPRREFPKQDEASLAASFAEAQKASAKLAPKVDALYATLAAGQADRERIKEKRWQAGYDLAMGRVMAAKVRNDSYNIMLAQAKSDMKFKDPKNDTWILEPSESVKEFGSQTEKLAKQARAYLERVVVEHPGTPWAFIAGEELKTPLGYEWKETHTGVKPPKSGDGGGGGNQSDDKKRILAPPKPKRPLKNL